MGDRLCDGRRRYTTDHSSEQITVPGVTRRLQGRLVSIMTSLCDSIANLVKQIGDEMAGSQNEILTLSPLKLQYVLQNHYF
jgi:hypothetical protein